MVEDVYDLTEDHLLVTGAPAEVASDRIPERLGEIERLRCRRGYAAGGGPSVTTNCLSSTPSVSGCTAFEWTAKR